MTIDYSDPESPYFKAFEAATAELDTEHPDGWTEHDLRLRVAEKGVHPETGEPITDLLAYQAEQRTAHIKDMIRSREYIRRCIEISEACLEDDKETYREESEAIAGLGLSQDDLEFLTAEVLQEIETETAQQTTREKSEILEKTVSTNILFREIRSLLLWADDPSHIAGLESACGMTQAASIDDWLEGSCWSDTPFLKPFLGGRGTPAERRDALRAAFAAEGSYPT